MKLYYFIHQTGNSFYIFTPHSTATRASSMEGVTYQLSKLRRSNIHDKSSPGLPILTFQVIFCSFKPLAFLTFSIQLIQMVFLCNFCPPTFPDKLFSLDWCFLVFKHVLFISIFFTTLNSFLGTFKACKILSLVIF